MCKSNSYGGEATSVCTVLGYLPRLSGSAHPPIQKYQEKEKPNLIFFQQRYAQTNRLQLKRKKQSCNRAGEGVLGRYDIT